MFRHGVDRYLARALRAARHATVVVNVKFENGVPIFLVPKAISGVELDEDPRLKVKRRYTG